MCVYTAGVSRVSMAHACRRESASARVRAQTGRRRCLGLGMSEIACDHA